MRPQAFTLEDGVTMTYVELGDPGGPPVVVVPGVTDGFTPLFERRVRRLLRPPPRGLDHYRVVMVSHRQPMPDLPTTTSLADDLAAFIDGRVGEPVVLSGHSLGAMVAQQLAPRRPGLVRAMTLSASLPAADDQLREVLERWERLVVAGRWREFYRDASACSYTGSEVLRRWLALRALGAPALPHLVPRHLALSHAAKSHEATDLGAIRCPTLVMAGTDDQVTSIEGARHLANRIPTARLVAFDGLGHGFPEQARRRYAATLRQFLDALEHDQGD